ncbi:alpha/beta fold hydrolase [Ponticoccus alexandrii]|uniref:Alpha/beta hydrolase n=1 Tax=Ponticoccus alexandrii TaxID=1943633 RepID=A0ABX7FFM8_9RHOB|nr:hypothetical protein [Ponticoccus alexandrii]QRF69360.1 alpha/beta hydrolase [Ponticoccus alexandrii]
MDDAMLPREGTQRFGGESHWLNCQWRRAPSGKARRPVLLAIHGSDRDVRGCIDGFSPIADRLDLHLLAPLFPDDPANSVAADSYKFLVDGGHDHLAEMDAALLAFCRMTGAAQDQTILFGFSGGAQFAHRYAYFRPRTLSGLIIAAPGNVTLPTEKETWWAGLDQAEETIGSAPDLTALREVAIAVLVGEEDLAKGLVDRPPNGPYGHRASALAGPTRLERARRLHESYVQSGLNSRFAAIPGAGHDLQACIASAMKVLLSWHRDE